MKALTVKLPDTLRASIKISAARSNITMAAWVISALRAAMKESRAK